MADKMLCGNCGNYHCCNFRPVSSASTNILKQTMSTKSTVISPMQSRDTFSQYQLDTRITPLDQTIVSSRAQSPLKIDIERPKSQSTYNFNNRRHYLFKKQQQKIASPIIQHKPILKTRASPDRLNISKGDLLRTPQRVERVATRSPVLSRESRRVGSSPTRYIQKRTISPHLVLPENNNIKNVVKTSLSPQTQVKTLNTAPQSIVNTYNSTSDNKKYFQNTQQPKLSIKPNFQQTNISHLKSNLIPVPINTSPSSYNKVSTIFPRPVHVMIPQTISKLQNSKTTVDGQSKVTFQNHHQCSYKDNRCFGFDFLGDQKDELKFDKTGHVKDIFRI